MSYHYAVINLIGLIALLLVGALIAARFLIPLTRKNTVLHHVAKRSPYYAIIALLCFAFMGVDQKDGQVHTAEIAPQSLMHNGQAIPSYVDNEVAREQGIYITPALREQNIAGGYTFLVSTLDNDVETTVFYTKDATTHDLEEAARSAYLMQKPYHLLVSFNLTPNEEN